MSDSTIVDEADLVSIRDRLQMFAVLITAIGAMIGTTLSIWAAVSLSLFVLAVRGQLNPHQVNITELPPADESEYIVTIGYRPLFLPDDSKRTLKLGKKSRINRVKEVLF